MKYTYKVFDSFWAYEEACKFMNDNHIPPERIISLTPIEYHKYSGYGTGHEVKKVVLFYIEE